MDDTKHLEIIIAALFHDFGKICQRAKIDDCLSPNMEGQLLPKTKDGRYSHKHAWYSHGAVLQLKDCLPNRVNCDVVARLAASHHNPGTKEEWIIAEADRLSSGADRSPRELDAEQGLSFIEQPALSVFNSLDLGNGLPNKKSYYSLKPLSAENAKPEEAQKYSSEDYRQIWVGLKKDLLAIKTDNIDTWLEAVNSALEHWTWAVPSTTIDQPDISLYDHLKTTAAFASAIWLFYKAEWSQINEQDIRAPDKERFILLSGDVSGIQNYIFDLKTAKGSAKMLRSRSFMVKVMADSSARMIEREFGATGFAEISNAGGRFLLVLPALENYKQKTNTIREKIELECIKRFFGQPAIIISEPVLLSKSAFMQSQYAYTRKLVDMAGREAKQKKLQSGLNKIGAILGHEYEAITAQAEVGVCPSCELRAIYKDGLCRHCKELHVVGTDLPKAKILAISKRDFGKSSLTLLDGEKLYLYDSIEKAPTDSLYLSVRDYIAGYAYLKLPYIVPEKENGDTKEFSELAEDAKGAKHLAMFKADLDNLGAIFSIGLGERASISRYSSISRTLDYFFGHVVRHIIFSNPKFQNIYSVFSGGDDLCVLGPWDKIIELAECIEKQFRLFTGNNNNLTISGGIALAGSGLPVGRIVEEAEAMLELSKEKPEKNSISIFGLSVGWEDYRLLLKDGNFVADKMLTAKTSTSLIYSMIESSRMAEAFDRGQISMANSLWKSHFLYKISRTNADKEVKEVLTKYAVNSKMMRNIRIVASIALYANRSGGS